MLKKPQGFCASQFGLPFLLCLVSSSYISVLQPRMTTQGSRTLCFLSLPFSGEAGSSFQIAPQSLWLVSSLFILKHLKGLYSERPCVLGFSWPCLIVLCWWCHACHLVLVCWICSWGSVSVATNHTWCCSLVPIPIVPIGRVCILPEIGLYHLFFCVSSNMLWLWSESSFFVYNLGRSFHISTEETSLLLFIAYWCCIRQVCCWCAPS